MDPATSLVPPHVTFEHFIAHMSTYFGGGVNQQTLQRSLINLRQTGSVAEFAVAFQNITNAFHPNWTDAPLIFEFMQKLKEVVRFRLIENGSLPLTLQGYVAAALLVESNQADANSSRGISHPPAPSRQPFIPKTAPPSNQQRLQHNQPPSHGPTGMDIDGTSRPRGPLSPAERQRRFDAGLCAYCGKPGHVSVSCPNRGHQARGTFQIPGGFQLVPQSQPQPQYPGDWHQIPPQHLPPSNPPAANPPAADQPGNSRPSQ